MKTADLQRWWPSAFNALPEPYQADDCLLFFVDDNSNLHCIPNMEEEHILGQWEAIYDTSLKEWVSV